MGCHWIKIYSWNQEIWIVYRSLYFNLRKKRVSIAFENTILKNIYIEPDLLKYVVYLRKLIKLVSCCLKPMLFYKLANTFYNSFFKSQSKKSDIYSWVQDIKITNLCFSFSSSFGFSCHSTLEWGRKADIFDFNSFYRDAWKLFNGLF